MIWYGMQWNDARIGFKVNPLSVDELDDKGDIDGVGKLEFKQFNWVFFDPTRMCQCVSYLKHWPGKQSNALYTRWSLKDKWSSMDSSGISYQMFATPSNFKRVSQVNSFINNISFDYGKYFLINLTSILKKYCYNLKTVDVSKSQVGSKEIFRRVCHLSTQTSWEIDCWCG